MRPLGPQGGGKSTGTQKSNRIEVGKGWGRGNTVEQMKRRRERRESRQENRDLVNQISPGNKTKLRRWGRRKVALLPLLCLHPASPPPPAGAALGMLHVPWGCSMSPGECLMSPGDAQCPPGKGWQVGFGWLLAGWG